MHQKYLKSVCLEKYQSIWTINYQNISADLEKIIARNIVLCTCLTNVSVHWIMESYLDYCLETYLKRLTAFHAAHGFSFAALRLMHSYLTNRKQRTKINSSYSFWEEILFEVPKGSSILGPLFLCDMFFLISETEFASYDDDNTPYVAADNIDNVNRMLENDSIRLFKWFSDNQMKANKDKFRLIVSNNEHDSIKIDDIEVESSDVKNCLE